MRFILRPVIKILLVLVLAMAAAGLLWLNGAFNGTKQSYGGKAVGQSIALIIPGFNENEDRYEKIEEYYMEVGITPIFIDMDWTEFNFKDLIENGREEIETVIGLYPNREIYFFGFSLGAVIALSTAQEYHSKGTILCSLSPAFDEDIKSYFDWFKKIVSPPSYESIPEETAVFLYGENDNSKIKSNEFVSRRKKIYSKSEFKMIKGAEHDITGEEYLDQIKQEIFKLREDDKNE